MSYIKQTLLTNEKIVYQTKPHWIIFANPLIYFVLAWLASKYTPRYVNWIDIHFFNLEPSQLLAAALLIVGIIYLIGAYFRYTYSEYGVTNKRVIMKEGFIERNSLEIFLEKIEGIQVYQSVLGRILNYGSINIIGTGGTSDIFMTFPNPLKFRHLTQEQMDRVVRGKSNQ